MAKKKSFKNQNQGSVASVFMSVPESIDTKDTNYTKDTMGTQYAQDTSTSRLNLKLKSQCKAYLAHVSWENKQSITQYLNDLIEKDMEAYNRTHPNSFTENQI